MKKTQYPSALGRILAFYANRHPYVSVGLGVWAIGCIAISIKTMSLLGLALIMAAVILLAAIHALRVFLEDLGSRTMKEKRRLRKEIRRQQLLNYLKE